ncbi:MAG: hypothetical protein ABI893_09830 [Polaromonas sp.]|uniref:hypothetical protein n=1 Tax=Polaromonas sp. TaxID=1869339 RepID=UPI00326406B0
MKINPQVVIDSLIEHITAAVLKAHEVEKLRQWLPEQQFSRVSYRLLGALPDGPAKLDFFCEMTLQLQPQQTLSVVRVLGQASHESAQWKVNEIYDVEVDPTDSSPRVP